MQCLHRTKVITVKLILNYKFLLAAHPIPSPPAGLETVLNKVLLVQTAQTPCPRPVPYLPGAFLFNHFQTEKGKLN